MRFQSLVDDFDAFWNHHVSPLNVATRVYVDLRGRSVIGVAHVGWFERGRQLVKLLPGGRLPDHEDPIHLSRGRFCWLIVHIEPKTVPDAIMYDEPFCFRVDLGKDCERRVKRFRVAAALGMPLAAAEGRTFPIRDAAWPV